MRFTREMTRPRFRKTTSSLNESAAGGLCAGRSLALKLLLTWGAILFGACLVYTLARSHSGVSLSLFPEVPRQGEPVIAVVNFKNKGAAAKEVSYRLFLNGELLDGGKMTIGPFSSVTSSYTLRNRLRTGEPVCLTLKGISGGREFERAVSNPAYPPRVWSSFMSFAAFSTTVMAFMTSAGNYEASFVNGGGLNTGLLCSLVLIASLIFLELSEPVSPGYRKIMLLRARISTLAWILLVIFLGMVFTKVAMILAV